MSHMSKRKGTHTLRVIYFLTMHSIADVASSGNRAGDLLHRMHRMQMLYELSYLSCLYSRDHVSGIGGWAYAKGEGGERSICIITLIHVKVNSP